MMIIKGITDEDFINYKKPAMFIAFPRCSFKCEKECGICCCQNSNLALSSGIEVTAAALVQRYVGNPISESVVIGGLEPFDTFDDLVELVDALRSKTQDDIVIYTGYNEDEVVDKLPRLTKHSNIIIKFGRFVPNDTKRYDEVLGIYLASQNQHAIKLS